MLWLKKRISKEAYEKLMIAGHITREKEGFFCDAAFTFRMGAGFAGDVTRNPDSAMIEPCLIDVNAPPTAYGQPVVLDPTTQGVRPIVAGDSALTSVYGFTVRPFPLQPSSAVNFGATTLSGATTPPANGIIDVLRSGYILSALSNPTSVPVKGTAVDVWFAVNSGAHVQGSVEAVHTGGSSFTIVGATTTTFNGGPDANGIVEVAFNI